MSPTATIANILSDSNVLFHADALRFSLHLPHTMGITVFYTRMQQATVYSHDGAI